MKNGKIVVGALALCAGLAGGCGAARPSKYYQLTVPADAPPAFIAVAADDQLLADASHPIFKAWKAAGRSAELHIYQRGGHGFGMNPTHGSADRWIDEFYWWMQSTGALTVR